MEEHGGRAEIGAEWQQWRGLAVELLVGAVLSIVLALMVALTGSAITAPPAPAPAARTVIVPVIKEELEDLNPRDPLVRCTVFETHTHCVREAS